MCGGGRLQTLFVLRLREEWEESRGGGFVSSRVYEV